MLPESSKNDVEDVVPSKEDMPESSKSDVEDALLGKADLSESGKKDADDAILSKADTRPIHKNQKVYPPTHRWWEPPLSAWIPQGQYDTFIIILVYNFIVVLLAATTDFCGEPTSTSDYQLCGDDYVFSSDKIVSAFSVGLFFLLAFRANQAYDRFWEGRKVWGAIRISCRDLSRIICSQIDVSSKDGDHENAESFREQRRRAIDFVAAYPVSVKLQIRSQREWMVYDLKSPCSPIAQTITSALTTNDAKKIMAANHMPMVCLDNLANYLSAQVKAGRFSDYQLGVVNSTMFFNLTSAAASSERIHGTPIPLSYVLQLRVFLMLWLTILPLILVAYYGWYTLLLSVLVEWAVLSIEVMAGEIENPFGYDLNDLDLDKMCIGISAEIHDVLRRAEGSEGVQA